MNDERSSTLGADHSALTTSDDDDNDDEFEQLLRGVAAAPEVPLLEAPELSPGTIVAQTYRVEQTLGRGGMGVVSRATDLRLDRAVALKIHSGVADARGLELLRVEAQAMAQLAHPNVVEVFEVGMHEGRLFIAMELVDGGTLRQWQWDRPWNEIVRTYLDAGQGLCAAHRAGLVHRDFKPENVLVGADSRPRVADFGLVLGLNHQRSVTVSTGEQRAVITGRSLPIPSGVSTRAIAGTPRYMAPEQHMGLGADHRSDQYAFCVALYEALAGEPPGPAADRPKDGAGPPALWRAIQRGLALDPNARHPDMSALLLALDRARVARRRWPWIAATLATLTAVAVAWGWWPDEPRAACRAEATTTATRWDASHARVRARRAEASPQRPGMTTLDDRLDAYTERWLSLRHAACDAATAAPRRDAAMHCLSTAARAVDGLLEILWPTGSATDSATEPTTDQAQTHDERPLPLPPLDRCSLDAATGPARPPPDPSIAAEVDAVLALVARSDALVWNGDPKAALEQARSALARAEPLGHPPTLLEAQLQVADAALESGDHQTAREYYEAGFYAAQSLGYDAETTDASGALIKIYTDLSDYEAADQWVEHARTSYERLGFDLSLELSMLSSIGILRQEQGRYQEALVVQRRQLELLPSEGDEIRRAKTHNTLGATYEYAGQHRQATVHFEQALTLFEARRGPDHPDNVFPMANMAWSLMNLGEFDRAEPLLHRAIDLVRRTNASDAYVLATLLSHLGSLHAERGQHQRALEVYREALGVAEPEFGTEHPLVGNLVLNMAGELGGLGQPEQERQTYERALGILERALGPEHDDVALALCNLAEVLVRQGQPTQALGLIERANAIYEAKGELTRSRLVFSLTITGATLMALERAPEAIEPLERAVRIASNGDVSPRERARAMLGLADALWNTDREHDRARRLARDARSALLQRQSDAETLAEIDAWLSEHPATERTPSAARPRPTPTAPTAPTAPTDSD
ncbi:MAG: serine/threonine-protein kinase [Myxococcota bacterium]